MQPYKNPNLRNAIRLPAINWSLNFFGGHSQKVKAGWHFAVEKHLAFEMIWILKGEENVYLAQRNFNLAEGDILVIPPNLMHAITANIPTKYFNFHFSLDDQEFTDRLIEQGFIYYPNATKQNHRLVKSLLPLYHQCHQNMQYSFADKLMIQKNYANFLLVLYQQTIGSSQIGNFNQLSYAGLIASELQRQFHKQLDRSHTANQQSVNDRLTIKHVMDKIKISPSYGFEVFKKSYGFSPRTYLSRLKQNYAKSMLLVPNYNIAEIGFALGYDEPSHFSRQFKRWTGLTPNEFRNQKH